MWIMCCVWTALEKQIIYFSMFRNLQKRELLLFLQLRYVLYVVGTIHFQVKRILISNTLLYNYKHLLFTRDERNLVLPWELTSPTLCPHFACDGCSNNSSSSQQQLKKSKYSVYPCTSTHSRLICQSGKAPVLLGFTEIKVFLS